METLRIPHEKLGLHAGESVTEKEGQKKHLNSVKLGFAGKEKVTEEGGHRHGTKKQLNSVKLGLPNTRQHRQRQQSQPQVRERRARGERILTLETEYK